MANAFLSDSLTSPGAIVTTTTSDALSASAMVNATSSARSLISSMTLSPERSAQPVDKSSLRSPHVSGTCFISTTIFIGGILNSRDTTRGRTATRIYYIWRMLECKLVAPHQTSRDRKLVAPKSFWPATPGPRCARRRDWRVARQRGARARPSPCEQVQRCRRRSPRAIRCGRARWFRASR